MRLEKDSFERIIENLQDGLYFVDRDRVITYWNKSAEQISGFTANEVVVNLVLIIYSPTSIVKAIVFVPGCALLLQPLLMKSLEKLKYTCTTRMATEYRFLFVSVH